jgi:hypothetical protein
VPGKRQQSLVEPHLPRLDVVRQHQRLGVVQQDLTRDAAKVGEGAFQPSQPGRLPFMAEGRHIAQPGIAQRRNKDMHLLPGPVDLQRSGAKINLQLLPGRRFETHCRPSLRRPFRSVAPAGPFHRAQAHRHALLPLQFLPHYVAVAAVLCKLNLYPRRQACQLPSPGRRAIRHIATRRHVALHRIARNPQFPRNPLRAPP